MITLYTIPGSAATVPRIALDEAGADYLMIELKRDETGRNVEPEGYDLLNPMGTVPTLVDDDLVVTEAAACCLYIAEKYPDAALMPTTGSHDWATTLRWLTLLTNTAQATFLRWYYPEQYTSDASGLEPVQSAAVTKLAHVAEVLSEQIADGPFLLGGDFTVADAFLAMLTGWGEDLAASERWSVKPALASHYNAVAARPAAGAVLTAEGFPGTVTSTQTP